MSKKAYLQISKICHTVVSEERLSVESQRWWRNLAMLAIIRAEKEEEKVG